jgi:hypothetical protein
MKRLANNILSSFNSIVNKNNKKLNVIDIITCVNRNKCIKGMKRMAKYLNNPDNKGIVYYFGHGDQVRDRNGDEQDGMDEKWVTQNILDDEISYIFNNIHNKSVLYLFSDSCSSGSMIDKKLNNKNWVTFSSSNDKQDSLTTTEGGVFTLWGIFPALEALYNPTPIELHNFITSNICIDTQTSLLYIGNDNLLNKKMF